MTTDHVLHQFNQDSQSFKKHPLPVPKHLKKYNRDHFPGKIIQDVFNPNVLWIGSRFGIYEFHVDDGTFVLHEIDKYVEPYGYQFATPLYQTEDGLIWYGHFRNEGVKIFDPKKGDWIAKMPVNSVPSSFIYDIMPYSDSLLIASIRGSHFMLMDKYDPGKFEIFEGNEVAGFSILGVDRNQNIYSTSPTGKLTKLNRYWARFDLVDLREKLNKSFVPWCILYDEQRELIYLSPRKGGNIMVLNPSFEYVTEINLFENERLSNIVIKDITKDKHSQILYLATSKGAYEFDPESREIQKLFTDTEYGNGDFENIIIQGDEMWVISKKYLLRNSTGKLQKIEIPNIKNAKPEIKAIEFIDYNQMFVSTSKGLFLYDLLNNQFSQYTSTGPFGGIDNEVDCNSLIYKEGEIWMGTGYNGIYKLTRIDSFSFDAKLYYNPISSLTNWNQSIDFSDDQIWSSTSSGFTVFDTNKEDFISFQKTDGIFRSYRKMKFYRGPDGSFINPFHYGYYHFKPQSIVADTVIPYLIKLKVNNLAINYKDGAGNNKPLTFDYDENVLTFILGAQNYGVDNKNYYRYRLKGLSDEWVFLENNNTINFTNLGIGDYTLEFDARSFHSYWNEDAYKLNFKINPHPLLSWWFKLIYTILGLLLFFSIYKFRENARLKKQKLLALQKDRAESELTALKAQMNPHFLFNTLNSINWFIIKNHPVEASKYLTKFSKLMRLILDNSKEDRISLARELETLNLYTELEQVRFEDEFEYKYTVDDNIDQEKFLIPPLIFQPFIENAIWHGLVHKEGMGHINLHISSENGYIKCIIEDDGIGREAAMKIKEKTAIYRQSSGIEITKNRIKGVNNNKLEVLKIIDLLSVNGTGIGTRIEILLPKETLEKEKHLKEETD